MKKDLAFSLLVFCLTLIANFVMDDDHHFRDGKSVDVEKTAYGASEMIRDNSVLAVENQSWGREGTLSKE
jgi:hypothetical protein